MRAIYSTKRFSDSLKLRETGPEGLKGKSLVEFLRQTDLTLRQNWVIMNVDHPE